VRVNKGNIAFIANNHSGFEWKVLVGHVIHRAPRLALKHPILTLS
jgi:hypothetical protein